MEYFHSSPDCPFLIQEHGAAFQRGSVFNPYCHSGKRQTVYWVITAVVFVDVTLNQRAIWILPCPPAAGKGVSWPHLFIVSFSEVPFNDIYEGKCHTPSTQKADGDGGSPDGHSLTVNPQETWKEHAFLFTIRPSLDTEILSWLCHFWKENLCSIYSRGTLQAVVLITDNADTWLFKISLVCR